MAKPTAEVIDLRTAVATLTRAHESQKRRHREQAAIIAELVVRVKLLECIVNDDACEFGANHDEFAPFASLTYSGADPLPKQSAGPPPLPVASGAQPFPRLRLFFMRLLGRIPR